MSRENTTINQDEENEIESREMTLPPMEGFRSIILIPQSGQPAQVDSPSDAGGQSVTFSVLRPMFTISAQTSQSSTASPNLTIIRADTETGLPFLSPSVGQGHTQQIAKKKKRKDTESEMERLRKMLAAQSQPRQLKGRDTRPKEQKESLERQKETSEGSEEGSKGQKRSKKQDDKSQKQDGSSNKQSSKSSEKISSEQTETIRENEKEIRISKPGSNKVTGKEMKKEGDMPKIQKIDLEAEKGESQQDKISRVQRVTSKECDEESKDLDKRSKDHDKRSEDLDKRSKDHDKKSKDLDKRSKDCNKGSNDQVEKSKNEDISLQYNQDCSDKENYEQSQYLSDKNKAVFGELDIDNKRQGLPEGKADVFKPPLPGKENPGRKDAFKTSFKGNADSMDFIKDLWLPVSTSQPDKMQVKGYQLGSGSKISPHNTECVPDRFGSTELSDSDTEEFSNDLICGGKHNIQMKGGNSNDHGTRVSLSRSSSNTTEELNTSDNLRSREITLESPLELSRGKPHGIQLNLKVGHKYENASGTNNQDDGVGGKKQNSVSGKTQSSDAGKTQSSENIITVDNSFSDCGQLFTRLKPNSIRFGSSDKNQLPINTEHINTQTEYGHASDNIAQMHERSTDLKTGLSPKKSLNHSQHAHRFNQSNLSKNTSELGQLVYPYPTVGGYSNKEVESTSLPPLKIKKERTDPVQNRDLQDQSNGLDHEYEDNVSQSQSPTSPHSAEEHTSHSASSSQQPCPVHKVNADSSLDDYSDTDHKASGDWVTSLNTLAEHFGFIVKDVTPDGNCMFNAIVDQLRISGNFDFTPQTLRKEAVSYLRDNPVNKDGTHLESFLHRETWEMYLARMAQDSVWGDHMALQACAEVTGYRINVIKYPLVITKLEPASSEAEEYSVLFLGHVSESHFISLRHKDWEETWHIRAKIRKLQRDFPRLFNIMNTKCKIERIKIKNLRADVKLLKTMVKELEFSADDKKKPEVDKSPDTGPEDAASIQEDVDEMTSQSPEDADIEEVDLPTDDEWKELEDWLSFKKDGLDLVRDKQAIDGTSNLPLPHMKTIIVNMIRPTYLSNKPRDIFNINFQHCDSDEMTTLPVGAAADELSYSFKNFKLNYIGIPDKIYPSFIGIHEAVVVHEQEISDMKIKDVIADSTLCTPGYTHLRPVNPEHWKQQNQLLWLEDTKPFLMHMKMHGNYHHTAKMFSGLRCATWPKCALEWATRDRAVPWPPSAIMQDILKTDCLVISKSHPKGLEHQIEWLYVFPNAEEILAKRCLTEDQRYCFSVFKVLVDFHTRYLDNNLRSTHFKTVLFYTCEDVPTSCWSDNIAGCVLYLLDKLLFYIKSKNLPNYFITANNMIDDFPEKSLERLAEKLEGVRMFPVASVVFSTEEHGIMLTFIANEILESVRQYSIDRSIKSCVTLVLAPVVMNLAKYFFRWGYNTRGCQAVQRAYGEILSYLEDVEKIPDFEQFVFNSLNEEDEYMKYLIAYQLDKHMDTKLLSHLGTCDSVRTVGDLIGTDSAGNDACMPVPGHITGDTMKEVGFVDDLAGHYFHQGKFLESARLVRAAIKKAKQCEEYVVDVSHIKNRDTKEDIARQNYKLMQSFNCGLLTCFRHLYMCYNMLGQVHLFKKYICEYEEICDRSGVRYHYSTVAEIWRKLGREDKYAEVQRKRNASSLDEDTMYDID